MDEQQRARLRAHLKQYPGATDEGVALELEAYEARESQKSVLLERGFSNALAEAWLDRAKFPRPPGWHSVFFYPESLRPRNTVLFWLGVFMLAAWFAFS